MCVHVPMECTLSDDGEKTVRCAMAVRSAGRIRAPIETGEGMCKNQNNLADQFTQKCVTSSSLLWEKSRWKKQTVPVTSVQEKR